jgi:hypothetical protein
MTADDLIDQDELEEMHAALRDHLRASDLVEAVEWDRTEAREVIADLLAVVRHHVDAMHRLALALRHQPTMADRVAGHLEELADALGVFALGQPDPDEESPTA